MISGQKVGLALGSGGFRGLAHIGVIKVLQKNNIPIDYISGASAGSLVGSYFALYGEVESLEKLLLENTKELAPVFFDFGFTGGFIQGKKLKAYLEKTLNKSEFKDTKIPFISVGTDLITGQSVYAETGPLTASVMGSMAVPLVFKPMSIKGHLLVDGGMSDPVPVQPLLDKGMTKVIAVNLYHKNEFKNKKFTMSVVALRCTRIVLHNLSKVSVKNAAIVLNPDTSHEIENAKINDYLKPEVLKKVISIGEKEAKKHLSEIKESLGIL